jgi:hypothetical protein
MSYDERIGSKFLNAVSVMVVPASLGYQGSEYLARQNGYELERLKRLLM